MTYNLDIANDPSRTRIGLQPFIEYLVPVRIVGTEVQFICPLPILTGSGL